MKRSAIVMAALVAVAALAQDLPRLPDSLTREQKRIDRYVPDGTKDRADDVAGDLFRLISDGRANDLMGELGRLVRNSSGRTPTTIESDVLAVRALSTTLRLQDREVKEVLKYRDQVGRIRRSLRQEQDDIVRRARQLGVDLKSVKVEDAKRPIGWPMNEPIHAARSGVPVMAWSKEELAQTYHNHEQQLAALDQATGQADRLDVLTGRRSRIVSGLEQAVQRTSRLSDDVLRKVKL